MTTDTLQPGRSFHVHWSELPRWDINSARAAAFRAAHPDFRPLGDFIEEATELVRPWEQPQKDWPVYGVNNRDGVFLSHQQRGDQFNAPYKRIERDWFFHNPTRANVGSLGRVLDVPSDAITSPEYQVWRIQRGLLSEFVDILIGLPFFLELIDMHRVGAVKERLFVQNLCEIPVPCLGSDVQREIVKRWRAMQSQIQDARKSADEALQKAEANFMRQLGFEISATTAQLPKAFAAHWKNVDRWSVSSNQQALNAIDVRTGKYPAANLGSILELVQYGTSAKANTLGRGVPILRIKNIKDGVIDFGDLKHIVLTPRELEQLRLEDDDMLVIRTSGSRDLVGRTAVFHGSETNVFASYLIRMRFNKDAISDYVSAFLNSAVGRRQIDAVSRQIMQNNINTEELRALHIPLPPLRVQRILAKNLSRARADAAGQCKRAEQLRKRSKTEIEQQILGRGA